eukprot:1264598-Amphidinium_carterae.1
MHKCLHDIGSALLLLAQAEAVEKAKEKLGIKSVEMFYPLDFIAAEAVSENDGTSQVEQATMFGC